MYDQVCYQKSFLKQVIVKVDFASPLVEIQKGVPTKLLNTIIKTFPIIEPAEMLAHELSINGDSVQSKQTMIKQWNYFTKDRSSQLTLSSESIFVLYVL